MNPATVTPFAAATPVAIYLSSAMGSAWFLPMFGLSFILALAGIILWLPMAGPILHILPGKRKSFWVIMAGTLTTAAVVGGVGALLFGVFPKNSPDVPLWLGSVRMALLGAYFGLVATLCLYIDPNFRAPPAV